ncbi:MAG: sulfate ABC transporter substrate-binding protein [Rickettsiales bacterium]|jgi:sulfate transport system substrate-binding protein|nr:sulfate ABC transporter substrate-binding protein [Rickettsiales bacterium]
MFLRLLLLLICISSIARADSFLHVSFDITRELCKELNAEFVKEYNIKTKIRQSHGGSGKQTSSIIYGLPADVVSLALPYHMDLLADKGLVAKNWRDLFPNNSAPFTTSIAFLVRKGNPKNIQDWSDLVKPEVSIIPANPKTSGGALWNYVAAWIYADKAFDGDRVLMQNYMKRFYQNTPVLDATARGAAVTFIKRKMGDVLITWANEAKYIVENLDPNYEIVYPSLTVKIDVPVATIINSKKNYQELANNYINFLFSKKGQEIIAKYYYQKYDGLEPVNTNMIDVEDYVNWKEFKNKHFSEGGIFDQIYQ